MKILELNIIEFGCLKDTRLDLSSGLNIIRGDNESGKSTVMLFIKFMLYGLPSRKARGTDRERSISFSGRRAAGTMTLENGSKQYRIERNAVDGGTKLNETLTVTDLSTFDKIPGEPGELFLGVPADVFESSCSIAQMRATDISKAGAAGAIENMLVSSDESIDVEKILSEIDKVRKEYKLNRGDGGRLYDTEKQISQLKTKHRDATERYLSYNEMSARLQRMESDFERASAELEGAQRLLTEIKNAQTVKRFDELAEQKKKLSRMQASLAELEGSISFDGFIPDNTHVTTLRNATLAFSETEKKYRQKQTELTALSGASIDRYPLASEGEKIEAAGGKEKIMSEAKQADSKAQKASRISVALFALGAVGIIAAVIFGALKVFAALAAFAIIAAASAVIGALNISASSKAKKQRDSMCEQYGKPFSELEEYLNACMSDLNKQRTADSKVITVRAHLDSADENKKAARARLCQLLSKTSIERKETDDELISFADAEANRLYSFWQSHKEITRDIYTLDTLIRSGSAALAEYDEQALRDSLTMDISELTPQRIAEVERLERFSRSKVTEVGNAMRNLRETLAGKRAVLDRSPVELADLIGELERKLEADTRYYNALMLAKEGIEQANMAMSGNVTPAISAKAGEMLALISGGKHASVQTTKNFDLSVEQDGFHVACELLSGGTKDAAYICLRIALMLRLFGDDLPPLMMDESLCQLDEKRASMMLRLIGKLSENTLQCILFTCHAREASICRELGIVVNEIRI